MLSQLESKLNTAFLAECHSITFLSEETQPVLKGEEIVATTLKLKVKTESRHKLLKYQSKRTKKQT